MAALKSTPLILFSGLAADANMFVPQKIAFPQLIVPNWPTPRQNETLDSYCDRIADDLRPHGRAILGGASFGGIIALHVAKRIDPSAVLLIIVRGGGHVISMTHPTAVNAFIRSVISQIRGGQSDAPKPPIGAF